MSNQPTIFTVGFSKSEIAERELIASLDGYKVFDLIETAMAETGINDPWPDEVADLYRKLESGRITAGQARHAYERLGKILAAALDKAIAYKVSQS